MINCDIWFWVHISNVLTSYFKSMRENRPRIKPEEVQFQDELSDDNQVHSNQVNLKEFTQLLNFNHSKYKI